MDYDQAMEGVEDAGKYGFRQAWAPGAYVHLSGTQVYMYPADAPYVASTEDQNATDWALSDHPPHP